VLLHRDNQFDQRVAGPSGSSFNGHILVVWGQFKYKDALVLGAFKDGGGIDFVLVDGFVATATATTWILLEPAPALVLLSDCLRTVCAEWGGNNRI